MFIQLSDTNLWIVLISTIFAGINICITIKKWCSKSTPPGPTGKISESIGTENNPCSAQ